MIQRTETATKGLLFICRLLLLVGTTLAVLLSFIRFVDVDQLALLGVVPIAPFIAAFGFVLLAATFGVRACGVGLVLVSVAGILAMPGTFLPRTGCDVTADRDTSSLVVFSHNALVGNQMVDEVAKQVLSVDPDLVLLQESPSPFVTALQADLDGRYPHRETLGLQTFLSRWPLTNVTATGTNTGGAVIATMRSPEGVLRVANFHASAPVRPDRRANQRQEYAAMQEWRASEQVDIVMGDFNAGGAQPLFRQAVSGEFVDAHRSAGCGFGLSWKRSGTFALLSLDHALVNERNVVESFEVLDYAGSDHKAIAVRIRAEPIN